MSVEMTVPDQRAVEKVFDNVGHLTTLKIAMMITARAKALSPVALEHGGRLRNSLMWKVGQKDGGLNDSGGPSADKRITLQPKNDIEGLVGANLDYAVYQEFGTRKMAPQPYLRPAIALVMTQQTKDEIRKMIDNEHALGPLKEGQKRTVFY